ncbi:flavodoxin family protein [Clostridium tetani]|uniref:Flavodoxin family protein n=1 Tax=Clostridium tetani TaxID=1513 RepID=A0ABY0ENV1_CLOTA|nr:flavodoxin family protein [Clostridium tetani]CDI49077.1 iron-sulfur flavoprotein [Clostridium tetani 12124569]KHO39627.1 iron-sulfur protein [Clostridium tetani]RXI38626.1 flavodoxin family protein [Clostridium tetani]RXI55432.1 flavodoxin family protein [Clostridium tetani]RXI68503.1 flavodoxin family protein [Clostridium tetani]
MKVLVLFSSPNKKGNTFKLLEKFLEGLNQEVDFIDVYHKKIGPCIDCKVCYKVEECAIKDDMTEIYKKINESDLIVIATPIYFANVPSPLKALIDRLQVYWSKKYIRKDRENIREKTGVVLAVGGTYWDNMFMSSEEVLGLAFAAMDVKDIHKVYGVNTDHIPIEKNEEVMKMAYDLGCELKNKY